VRDGVERQVFGVSHRRHVTQDSLRFGVFEFRQHPLSRLRANPLHPLHKPAERDETVAVVESVACRQDGLMMRNTITQQLNGLMDITTFFPRVFGRRHLVFDLHKGCEFSTLQEIQRKPECQFCDHLPRVSADAKPSLCFIENTEAAIAD